MGSIEASDVFPRIGPAHLMTALDTNGISISDSGCTSFGCQAVSSRSDLHQVNRC